MTNKIIEFELGTWKRTLRKFRNSILSSKPQYALDLGLRSNNKNFNDFDNGSFNVKLDAQTWFPKMVRKLSENRIIKVSRSVPALCKPILVERISKFLLLYQWNNIFGFFIVFVLMFIQSFIRGQRSIFLNISLVIPLKLPVSDWGLLFIMRRKFLRNAENLKRNSKNISKTSSSEFQKTQKWKFNQFRYASNWSVFTLMNAQNL